MNSSWAIGSSHHFLSFSSDGTAIAGTGMNDDPFFDKVQFWETTTGAATSSFTRSSFVVFSPTDPNIAALVRPESIHMLKRDSFGGKTWGGQYNYPRPGEAEIFTFNSDGSTILQSWFHNELREFDVSTWSHLRTSSFVHKITSAACCPIKPGWFVVGDQNGEVEVISDVFNILSFQSYGRLSPVDPVKVTACAWSQDGKWIATGNAVGDIFLWNAGDPISFSFAMLLPRNQPNTSNPTSSLVFVPDSTALIIISGCCLSVWDIGKVEYVTNTGLPDTADNIAFDGPRNRLAVAANERITIYELKLAEQMRQMDGKSYELADFDITNAVVKFDPKPRVGLHFDIHRGSCKLDTPRISQHVVSIKVLHPAFKARDDAQEQQDFNDVRKLNFVPLRYAIIMLLSFTFHLAAPQVSRKVVGIDTR